METLWQDLRYALRALSKNPAFSAIAVLTLALGIGANTALFSVMNAVLLRTLPVRDPQQLVVLSDPEFAGMQNGTSDGERAVFTWDEYQDLRDHNQVFSSALAFSATNTSPLISTSSSEDGTVSRVSLVSANYFPTLGVGPQMGHAFGPEADQGRGQYPQAVVSYAFWQLRLHGDPAVLEHKIRIRNTVFDIIGVMPAEFTGIVVGDAPDMWVPLTMQMAVAPGRDWLTQKPGSVTKTMFLHIVGRLKPGVALAQANASVNITFENFLKAEANTISDVSIRGNILGSTIRTRDARHGLSVLRGTYERPLDVLMGLVGLLLLLACANVANLLMARATGRQRELGVRVALGADRGRLIRQLLTESVLLAAIGATVGLLLAHWGDRLLLQMVSADPAPVPLDVHLDLPVLAFTIGLTLVTGILFGLAPALRATRVDLNHVLRGTSRSISGGAKSPGRLPIGKVLVATQVAISLVLLVAAGLFVRNLQKLTSVPLGYNSEQLLMFRILPATAGYKGAAIAPLLQDFQAKFATIPGVRSVSLSENGLFYGTDSNDQISIVGMPKKSAEEKNAAFDEVGPNYFSTIGIPILMGRDIEERDQSGARKCWINESLAKHFFGNENPLGHHLVDEYPDSNFEFEIAGVVGDARPNGLRGPIDRRFYVPIFNPLEPVPNAVYEMRYSGDVATITSGVRGVVHQTNASLDPPVFRTVPALIDARLLRDRLTARLSSFFGAIALLLACIGLYGVLSYTVTRRTSEIGIRMALGAQRGNVLRLILREALGVTLIGTVAGLGVALAATRLLERADIFAGLFYGLSGHDPATIFGSATVLIAVATLAASIPAWRASRTDPMTALHYE
jgi:predicted permease